MDKISVIIATKNEEKNIGRCLKSLQRQTGKEIEIIVVDNHSTDQTAQIVKNFGAKIFQVGPERSTQRNFGAQKASGEILFFIDADMTLEQKVIDRAAKLLKEDKSTKAVIVPEKTVGKSYWARVRTLERSFYLNDPTIEAARIFDKRAFLKIGGFDETLVAAEDWDLTHRMAAVGKISRTKAAITHHEGQLSLINHLKKKYYYAKDIRRYAQKHPDKFREQSGLTRLKVFAKDWRQFAKDPIYGIGVLILKSLEYLLFLFAKIK